MSTQVQDKEIADAELVRMYLQTHNDSHFNALYRRYAAKVYGKCYSILKDTELAHDAVQDIFIKVMMNIASFGEKSQFSTWLYSITYNYCIDSVRKKKKEKILFAEDIERAPDVAEQEVPDEYLMEMEVQYLKKVLDALPQGDKMVLVMKYEDDMSIKEIADIVKKTESATKMQIKRAKHKAFEIFEKVYKHEKLEMREERSVNFGKA